MKKAIEAMSPDELNCRMEILKLKKRIENLEINIKDLNNLVNN